MILDSGLDATCTTLSVAGISNSYPAFAAWLSYAAFGTGSAAPDVSQTTLGAQVGARSNNRGGFNNSADAGIDTTNGVIWYEATFTRVFSIGSNVNAAEWGLAAASTGNLSVRELFRTNPLDNGSTPITLTLESGDELQLVITVRVEADWGYVSKSFDITGTLGNDGNGAHAGQGSVSSGNSTTAVQVGWALQSIWPGGYSSSADSALHVYLTDKTTTAVNQNFTGDTDAAVAGSPRAYTPGAFYRDCDYTFSTSLANGNHYVWIITWTTSTTVPSNFSSGYRFLLDDPAYLTKAGTHKLTLTVRKNVARL